MSLKVGDQAPSFDVLSSEGRRLRLEDFRGKQNVVLYFYPKDNTSVCTAEACGFRDMYADLATAETEVIGVSADDEASHKGFAAKHRVPFPLVTDKDLALAKSFGATSLLGSLRGQTGRITYVIDKQGKIVGVFDSLIFANAHLKGVKETIAKLKS
jgi:peroxiredoxin Q/BCP